MFIKVSFYFYFLHFYLFDILFDKEIRINNNHRFLLSCPLNTQRLPSLPGNELKENSRPNSMASNSSFHSTQDEFHSPAQVASTTQVEEGEHPVKLQEEGGEGGSKEEIRILKQALESLQIKLIETKKEYCLLQAQLNSDRQRQRDEDGSVREKIREEELMESLAELQAKLTDTQERYHQAMEEVEDLKAQMGRGEEGFTEKLEVEKLEHEIKQLKVRLVQLESEKDETAQRIRLMEEALQRTEEERRTAKEKEQRSVQIKELYKEAQEEVRMLQVKTRSSPINKVEKRNRSNVLF